MKFYTYTLYTYPNFFLMWDESDFSLDSGDSDSSSNEDSSYGEDDLDLTVFGGLRQKNKNYLDDVVPKYTDNVFFEHFRVSRSISKDISCKYANSIFYNKHCGHHGNIPAYHQILIFLWYMGHEAASYCEVADRFDVSISTLHKIISKVTYFISNLAPSTIIWPNDDEKSRIEQNFRRNGFPNVIGALDGYHIRIDKPEEDPDSYLNRKKYYSIQMQVTCDDKRQIRDIFIGYPGSVHDSIVFRNSTLGKNLQEKCGQYFLLGDSRYPLKNHLLTPYKDRGNLTRWQQNFNTKLSKNRCVIEHCFGMVKQKFRQLYHIKLRGVHLIVNFIRAACVLHNIALSDEFNVDEGNVPGGENHHLEIPEDEGDNEEQEVQEMDAQRIRDVIAKSFKMQKS